MGNSISIETVHLQSSQSSFFLVCKTAKLIFILLSSFAKCLLSMSCTQILVPRLICMFAWASQVILSVVRCCMQCLVKPPVKESTMPVDLMLHSDVRAVERTEFDQQVHSLRL